ncbi:MAG: hypothetical protein ABI665_07530 [Vicinamibacterales bacterium]
MAQDSRNRGDDAVGRFVAAVETSVEFGNTLKGGDRDKIAAALKQYRIELAPKEQDQFINACIGLASVGGWEPLNEIRKSLLMPPGAGIMG